MGTVVLNTMQYRYYEDVNVILWNGYQYLEYFLLGLNKVYLEIVWHKHWDVHSMKQAIWSVDNTWWLQLSDCAYKKGDFSTVLASLLKIFYKD